MADVSRSDEDGPGAPSVLTSVVVYAAGAVCTRRAQVALPTGPVDGAETTETAETTVRIDGLPTAADARSLRGRVVSGPAGLRVTDLRLDVGAVVRRADGTPNQRMDLEDAEDRLTGLYDRQERLTAEIEEVAGLRAEPPAPRRGDPPRWAPVESFLALAGFVDSRLAVLYDRLRTTEDRLADAEHEVGVLRARVHESSTALETGRTAPSVSAVVTLAPEAEDGAGGTDSTDATDTATADTGTGTDTGGPVEIEVEYRVPGASWVPTYQLRLDGTSGAGTLVLRACVAQRTGEDWSGVRLGLSTADLLRRADLPELRSLRIGRSQEAPAAAGWREPPGGLDDLFTGYDSAPVGRPRDSRVTFLLGAVDFEAADSGAADREVGGYGGTFGGPGGPVPPPAPAAALPPSVPQFAGAPPAQTMAAPDRARRSAPRLAAPGAPAVARKSAERSAPGSPIPSADLLDYARLTVAGPDAPEGRGTLRPRDSGIDPAVVEYRRRAEQAEGLGPPPAHAIDVRTSAGSFDYRFDTAAPADVASDGRWHIVPVSEVPVVTESAYVCVPSVDTAVFGTVLLTNTSPHALLAGPADVMVDGDFVLTAALPTLAPGQRQTVGIGVAESVQVARRTHMRESTAGLRGGTTVLDHTVEVDVANRLPYPVTVEVRERVPVSTDKDVRIEERRAQPAWQQPDEPLAGQDRALVRGARVWRVEVAPGRTTTLTGGFEVRLPAGKSVVGGNRRN